MWGRIQLFLYGLLAGLLAVGVLLVVARRPPGHPVILGEPPTPIPLRVHVTGAVAQPGVYALPRGSIVQDALAAAGGLTARADVSELNLAQLLVEGDQVSVAELPPTLTPTPTLPPTATPAPTITVGPGTSTPTALPTATQPRPTAGPTSGKLININTATQAELETLPRIGPSMAARIIEYRTAHGPFQRTEDIMNVTGIGPATYAQIKNLITVGT